MTIIIQMFWFLIPAMWSNMAPVWAAKIKIFDRLNRPIDRGVKIGGQPLFGKNKTYRGFAAGVILALIASLLQYLISEKFVLVDNLELTQLDLIDYISIGFLLGFGALFGDLMASFFKRRLLIPAGSTWFPLDQIDYILGALLLTSTFMSFNISQYATAVFIGLFMHILVNYLGWKVGMRKHPI